MALFARQFLTSPGPRYTGSLHWWRWQQRRKILKTHPVTTAQAGEVSIRYLVCHDQILEALWAAKSLLADKRFRAFQLIFHDDGTVSANDVACLSYHFPQAGIILRRDSDQELNDLPSACAELRKRLVFGVKFFDVAHFSRGKPYLALDTDVLFFRNPDELYNALVSPAGIRWNQDPPALVSLCDSVDRIVEATGIQPKAQFNAGLLAVPRPFVDWDRIERWLTALGEIPLIWTAEQTLHAIVAALEGGAPLPETYDVYEEHWPNVVSEHYCSRSRRNMYRVGYPAVWGRLQYCHI